MRELLRHSVQNPWQQYFHDQEVRATIEQDVMRTYPELDFFQSDAVQTDLTNILFCYSRRHDEIGYRQARPWCGLEGLCLNLPRACTSCLPIFIWCCIAMRCSATTR